LPYKIGGDRADHHLREEKPPRGKLIYKVIGITDKHHGEKSHLMDL
jgi:hypothetical protein